MDFPAAFSGFVRFVPSGCIPGSFLRAGADCGGGGNFFGEPAAFWKSGLLSAADLSLALFVLCLLVVFRVLSYVPVLIVVAAAIFLVNRQLFGKVDYFLLLTFLCFFVFIGNAKRIPEISGFLASLVGGRELLSGILTSQVISNVPAAILLSGFQDRPNSPRSAIRRNCP